MAAPGMTWLDRALLPIAPKWAVQRMAWRARARVLAHYEAGAGGRRTANWNRSSADANAANALGGLATTRNSVRDLVRNNPYAEAALATIVDHTVGWGITAKPTPKRWKEWAETTACDADGRHDLAGLQKLVLRATAQDGEVLIRRRWRRPEDGLPLPMQLQVIEADHLDASKDGIATADGGRIIQGVEVDPIGRRRAYWLTPDHPGSSFLGVRGVNAVPIPASEILHIFRGDRPGQVRATSWFAPVVLRLKELDEYEDAALVKQKIAACLAVITTDVDGASAPTGDTTTDAPEVDTLYPGMILNSPVGRNVTVVDPPSVNEHEPFIATVLHAIAVGMGITYEDLTGNYNNLPFSAARMSRMRHWARVEGWRWRLLIPQFCDPVWRWARDAAALAGAGERWAETVEWTAPPMPMIDPEAEGNAIQRLIRNGLLTWDEAIRERGYDPDAQQTEIVARNKKWDAAGMTLDCDPRKVSQQGQPSNTDTAPKPAAATVPAGRELNGVGH